MLSVSQKTSQLNNIRTKMSKHIFASVSLGIMLALSSLSAQNTTTNIKATLLIVESIATSKVSVAFGKIENPNNFPITLQSITSNIAESTELHQTIQNADGTSKMQQVKLLQIPAKSSLNLTPNGYHIMLMGLKSTLTVVASAEIIINFIANPTNNTSPTQSAQSSTEAIKATVITRKSLNEYLKHIGVNQTDDTSPSQMSSQSHLHAH